MLESIRINNFRLFRELEISQLGRVNLFVGKNNSGKSALLEAVELYASNASLAVIEGLLRSRHENWAMAGKMQRGVPAGHSVHHLFFGHTLPSFGEDGIRIDGATEAHQSHSLHVTVAAFVQRIQEDGSSVIARVAEVSPNYDPSDIEPSLIAEEGGRIRRILRLNAVSSRGYLPPTFEISEASMRFPCQAVPSGNMNSDKLTELWDQTSLTAYEPEVIAALQLIDPSVNAVAFVDESRQSNRRIPLIKLSGSPEPLSLKSLGDGMTRLFHIVVALVNARGGVLLIDGFENGLHWSVQLKVWDILFRLAERLNVQIFATTHSRDCIASFVKVWSENTSSGGYYRLDNHEGRTTATRYTLDTLSDSLEMDVETR